MQPFIKKNIHIKYYVGIIIVKRPTYQMILIVALCAHPLRQWRVTTLYVFRYQHPALYVLIYSRSYQRS